MPVKIGDLPAHVLLVHAVVVLLPLAALMLVLGSVWPAARAKFGFLTPALALVALALVPVTTHAGEWLKHHLGFTNQAIQKHAELGDELLPWAVGIFVMAALGWVLHRRFDMSWRPRRTAEVHDSAAPSASGGTTTLTRPAARVRTVLPVWITAVVAVLSVAVAVGGVIQLYRIGDSGAHAVWNGVGTGR